MFELPDIMLVTTFARFTLCRQAPICDGQAFVSAACKGCAIQATTVDVLDLTRLFDLSQPVQACRPFAQHTVRRTISAASFAMITQYLLIR